MRTFVCLLLAVLLVAQPLVPSLAWADKEQRAKVTANSLNIRSGPGTDHPAVESIKKGQIVTVVGQEGDWVQIRLEDGTFGWASAKFLEILGEAEPRSDGKKEDRRAAPPEPKPLPPPKQKKADEGGGGSGIGSVFKWGCLLGAVTTGVLAFGEKSKGDDAYDEYKELAEAGRTTEADEKFSDAEDHDSKAQTFAIVGGSLFGLFLLQQFVLGGDDDSASLPGAFDPPPLAFDPQTGEVRATLVLARF